MVSRGKEHPWAIAGHVHIDVGDEGSTPAGSGLRIAIVHAQQIPRAGLAALLTTAANCSVVFAGEAVDQALRARPDVALVDVEPGASPVDGQVERLVTAGVKVLLIGGPGDSGRIRTAIDAGALGYVSPNASATHLIDALAAVSQGTLHITPELALVLAADLRVPGLSPREADVVRLFSTGMTLSAVARHLGVTTHTAKEYLDRARRKYADAGRPARTRTELYIQAVADGLIERGQGR